MSADKKKTTPFVPPNPPTEPAKPLPEVSRLALTASDLQTIMQMFTDFHTALVKSNVNQAERFKQMFNESGLKWFVIFAGVGGAVELFRLIVDGLRAIFK